MRFEPRLWRTSTYTDTGGQCVEVAMTSDAVGVRDTKNRAGGHLTVPASRFAAFIAAVKEHDGWRDRL